MARNLVNTNCSITYDGVSVPLMRGTVIEVPTGSALATALGANITALTSQQQIPGSSDSLGAGSMAGSAAGGGTDPYNAHQAG
jgi:hypothetical protein